MNQTTEAAPYRKSVHRSEVYFTEFSCTTGAEIYGTHPIVIVQNDIGNFYSGTVIGVVLTSSNKKENMPTHVILQEPGSPFNGSMAMAEQIFTIDKQRLRGFVGRLSERSMRRIDEAMRQSLSLNRKEPTMMCLCPRCVRAFEELPHHSVLRVDWKQQAKDTCTYCGMDMGYDYWIHDWSGLVKPKCDMTSAIVQ